MSIKQTILHLKQRESALPPLSLKIEGIEPMIFRCSFAEAGISTQEIDLAFEACPKDLREFWEMSEWAKLFEDVTYGQWGLEMFSPTDAVEATEKFKHQRADDFHPGDLIVGRFIGDSDLLLIQADSVSEEFGRVLIATPIDHREDWHNAAPSFQQFLSCYIDANGDKYWESKQ